MKIDTVRIRNFRCFINSPEGEWAFAFRPNKSINLIIGSNGSGKTALLDAINLVMNSEGRSNQALLSEYDFSHCDSNKPLCIEVVLTELGPALAEFSSDIQWIDPLDGECIESKGIELDVANHLRAVIIRFEAQRSSATGEIEWGWYLPKYPKTSFEAAKELSRSQHRALGFFRINPAVSAGAFSLGQYSPLGRHLRKLQYRLGKLPNSLCPKSLLPECNIGNPKCQTCPSKMDCLPTSDEDNSEKSQMNDSSDTIGNVLNKIVLGARDILGSASWNEMEPSLGPRYGNLTSALTALTIGLKTKTVETSGFIPFDRLSSGEKYALSFSLAKAQVPGDFPPVIVMEEPETSLYPTAIAALINDIHSIPATAAPQIIISSHSESVLRCFSPNEIFIMSKTSAPNNLKTAVESMSLTSGPFQKPEYLVMPGGPSALFANKILILEGAGDALVTGRLDIIAARNSSIKGIENQSFSSLGWCLFHACGASEVLAAISVLTALGKQTAALFDGDGPGKNGANETRYICPTFIFKSSCESNPTVEDALLLGMPVEERQKIICEFQKYSECEKCARSSKKCWREKGNSCPLGDREGRKRYLQSICLASYERHNRFPMAFSNLLCKLDEAKSGQIHELLIDLDDSEQETT